jgi:hypothetical protein
MAVAGTDKHTVANRWMRMTGVAITDALLEWPADVFALAHVTLAQTQAFRFVLSPPADHRWPPASAGQWSDVVTDAARAWVAWVQQPDGALPELLAENWEVLIGGADTPLSQLSDGHDWRLCEALLTIHAIADEACAVLFIAADGLIEPASVYRARSRELLARTGSLARIDTHLLRVLPKVRTPPTGRASFSRYACVIRGTAEIRWHKSPFRSPGAGPETEHVNALLLPWPLRVRASDFRPVPDSVQRREKEPYGLFEFVPTETLDLDLVDRMLISARDEVDSVDAVIMPESAIDVSEIDALEALLDYHGVVGLRAGVREPATQPGHFGRNWVHIGVNPRLDSGGPLAGGTAESWLHLRQNKHHRWSLDKSQIYQYHLGGALHPDIQWWEAMEVPPLSVQFVEGGYGSTTANVVCEDLTQNDEVAEILRYVGPTFVIAYLLDGPQLASRWAARYASVLADDPGSAVLTLTSYGMVRRSRPHGRNAADVIGLWKDPNGGTREIPLEPGAQGVLLTYAADRATRRSADGRWPADTGMRIFDVAINQIAAAERGSNGADTPTAVAQSYRLDGDDVTVLTGWAEGVAEALAYSADTQRALSLLAQARAGARWREPLGIAQPSAELDRALDAIQQTVYAAAAHHGVPALQAVLTATQDSHPDEPALRRFARRVLRSTLDQLRSHDLGVHDRSLTEPSPPQRLQAGETPVRLQRQPGGHRDHRSRPQRRLARQ